MPYMKTGRKRGRPPGPGKSTGVQSGSHGEWASSFSIGERRYVETTPETYHKDMSVIIPYKHKRPDCIKDFEFTMSFYTAVPTTAGGVRYLICVERIK